MDENCEQTGALAYEATARTMKRRHGVGGKSPNIIFEDADLDLTSISAILGIFGATGQICMTGSWLLVQNSLRQAFIDRLLAIALSIIGSTRKRRRPR
jgi:acyl-CoA reductase-like NAD-dependent aldehyde dehydrogenase